jgi:predicted nucleotidyltransferase
MGTIETKKLRALERLAASYSEELLDKVNALLDEEQEAYSIPEEHYRILEEEHQKYLHGELETVPWEEVEKRLRAKHGL